MSLSPHFFCSIETWSGSQRVPPRWCCFVVVKSCVTIEGIKGTLPIDRAVRSGWNATLCLVMHSCCPGLSPGLRGLQT